MYKTHKMEWNLCEVLVGGIFNGIDFAQQQNYWARSQIKLLDIMSFSLDSAVFEHMLLSLHA